MDSRESWGGQNHDMSPGAHVDFQQYLDLGMPGLEEDVAFNYDDFAPQHHDNQFMGQNHGDMNATMGHGSSDLARQNQGMMHGHPTANGQGAHLAISNGRPPSGSQISDDPNDSNSLTEIDEQIKFLQLQRQHQAQRIVEEQQQNYYVHQPRIVPSTPNSMEMHSRDRQMQMYSQQMQQQPQQFIYDTSDMQMREQQLAFTPLVSPAVTPLDTHFHMPDYSLPGAYFSPLTSPALHAETGYGSLHPGSQNQSSVGTSPTEMNLDLLPLPASHASIARKPAAGAGRKAPPSVRANRAVRQSPIVKPQQSRRKPTITKISPEALSELVEPALQSQTPSSQSHASSQPSTSINNSVNCSSENDSISPEQLSDMAPPPIPLPRSLKNSPYLLAQGSSHPRVQQLMASSINSENSSPATPASLMRIVRGSDSPTSTSLEVDADEDQLMEGFSLPEPAAAIDTHIDGGATPTLVVATTKETPSLLLPAAALSQPISTLPSPSPKAKPQSASAQATPSIRKTPKLAARGSQHRHSGSVSASPALLPKISPSIKPMVQGQSVSDNTASLLLATKSNYQNILEGTHLPGVSYPSELSTNLTSKRTSHKIAEQGRRNRINMALQEMATLLPENRGDKKSEGDNEKDEGTAKSASSSSKAATVEHAIEYIRQLKNEVEAANKRAEEAEEKFHGNTDSNAA